MTVLIVVLCGQNWQNATYAVGKNHSIILLYLSTGKNEMFS
jgi:hypothetical protein